PDSGFARRCAAGMTVPDDSAFNRRNSEIEIYDLGLQLCARHGQASHRNRQIESPWPRAAGVEIEDAVLGLDFGLVRMSGNDRAKSGRVGIEIQRVQVVQ